LCRPRQVWPRLDWQPFRPAEPIPRASQKLCRRFRAAMRFGSRNSMSLGGRCSFGMGSLSAGDDVGDQGSCPPRRGVLTRNSIPLDLLSRIPKASLGEPSGEGTAPLLRMISKAAVFEKWKSIVPRRNGAPTLWIKKGEGGDPRYALKENGKGGPPAQLTQTNQLDS
jgi:hypothetical protein